MEAVDLFAGTAEYCVKYREQYPQEFFDFLVEISSLDSRPSPKTDHKSGKLLDLGAGKGQLAISLAPFFTQINAVEPSGP